MIVFALRDLAICMKTNMFFLKNVVMKTRYFNTGFVFLRYKNKNQY